MSLQAYGLLKCKALNIKEERDYSRPHYHIHVQSNNENYRISINTQSELYPSELLFYTNESFQHPIISKIKELPYGFFASQSTSIDYIRGEMGFKRDNMKKIPCNKPGPDNDLNEKISYYINKAIESSEIDMYVFGSRWKCGNYCKADRVFSFQPSMGMHDIHMNQGNSKQWKKDDGVWQDGSILIHDPLKEKWTGIFLAFQSQSWNNNDCTGHSEKIYIKKRK